MTPEKIYEEKIERAALKSADDFYPDSKRWDSRDGNYYTGFKAGAKFSMQNPAPEVERLVEAVGKFLDTTESYDIYPMIKALADYEKQRGGE